MIHVLSHVWGKGNACQMALVQPIIVKRMMIIQAHDDACAYNVCADPVIVCYKEWIHRQQKQCCTSTTPSHAPSPCNASLFQTHKHFPRLLFGN